MGRPPPATNKHQQAALLRREALLHHARIMLEESGYLGASVNELIRRAGGSKATLVKYFDNKAGLFAAALEDANNEFLAAWQVPAASDAVSAEPMLRYLGEALLRLYLRPPALATYRGVIAEGHLQPAIGAAFYQHAEQRLQQVIAGIFTQYRDAGLFRSDDPYADAGRFAHMLRSGLYERVLLGLHPEPVTDAEIMAAVAGVARFCLR